MSDVESGVQLVAFDLDGVLVDSASCHAWAFEQLWRECGIEGPPYEALAGRTTLDVVIEQTHRLSPSDEQIRGWVAHKQAWVLECLERRDIAFPDTLPVLKALRLSGVPMVLATGASRARTEAILGRLGVRGWFRAVVTADDVSAGKPDPETYRAAIELGGAEPARTVVVEDSQSGVASGLDAGACVASVRTGVRVAHPRFLSALSDLRGLESLLGLELT